MKVEWKKEHRFAYSAFALVGLVYVVSLCLPSLRTPGGYNEAQFGLTEINYGIGLLIVGIGSCCGGNPVWLANPLLWAGMSFLWRCRWRYVWILGLLALLCSASGGAMFAQGNPRPQYELLEGYYVWVASTALLTLTGVIGAIMFSRPKTRYMNAL